MSTSPGPWRWVVEKPYGVTVTTLVDATGKVLICAEEEGGDCCDCTAVLDPPDPEDAALIAAAPEMAELLRKLTSPEVERSIERMADHDCEANPTILDEDIDRIGAICREARVLVGRVAMPAAPETK